MCSCNSDLLQSFLQSSRVRIPSCFDVGRQTPFLVHDDQCAGRPGRIYEASRIIGDLIYRYQDNPAQIKREVTEYCLRLQKENEAKSQGAELKASDPVSVPSSPVVDIVRGVDVVSQWDPATSFLTMLRWTADWQTVRSALQRHMQKVTGPAGRELSEEDWHWYGPRPDHKASVCLCKKE